MNKLNIIIFIFICLSQVKGEGVTLSDSSIVNVSFFIYEHGATPKMDIDPSCRIVTIIGEVLVDLEGDLVNKIISSIDSIIPVGDDLISQCFGFYQGYDSYLLIHLKNGKKEKVEFLCKEYNVGILTSNNLKYYVYFNQNYSTRLLKIAKNVRASMFPIKSIKE